MKVKRSSNFLLDGFLCRVETLLGTPKTGLPPLAHNVSLRNVNMATGHFHYSLDECRFVSLKFLETLG